MSEIVQQGDLIQKVTAQYRPYIEAMRTPALSTSNDIENLKSIYKSIIVACEYLGSAKNEDEQTNKFLADSFYKEVRIKYPHTRHGEIELAFKKGVLGDFKDKFPKDKFMAINVATLFSFLKFYNESTELLAAKREWVDLTETPRAEKPVSVVTEISDAQILGAYNDYLESGDIPVYGRVYYDAICKKKGLKTLIESEAQKEKIEEQAKFFYENDLKAKKINTKEPEKFKNLLASFDKDSNTFKSVAKRIALKFYFAKCKEKGENPI